MNDAWFAASVEEIAAFLDGFKDKPANGSRIVKADSDLVAALLGVLSGVQVLQRTLNLHAEAMNTVELLESDLSSKPPAPMAGVPQESRVQNHPPQEDPPAGQ